ncbi:baseplate J/gp47 family protein [Melaminivora sp.]|uniref:baseplate assembly protein n=1 Tax=Melaminivora sp. TaxID=1933032 RepID=UPI0028AC4FE5|nr:baseplate J/gp47 family protein [Melaminivora sp.]
MIDLSALPAPQVVEPLDYEALLAQTKAELAERLRAHLPAIDRILTLESDPIVKLLQAWAWRELLLRARINDAAHGVMLAYAGGADLEQLGANFGVQRLLVDAGDAQASPPRQPAHEDDASLRRRIQMAMEGFSTAGPQGAYVFHALGADARVRDVAVDAPRFGPAVLEPALAAQLPAGVIALQVEHSAGLSMPLPGMVAVTVLARASHGATPQPVLDAVARALNADAVRPLTDVVVVRAATAVPFAVDATLYVQDGPDHAVVRDAAIAALERLLASRGSIGQNLALSALYAALHQPGVVRVALAQPLADVLAGPTEAAHCTGYSIAVQRATP